MSDSQADATQKPGDGPPEASDPSQPSEGSAFHSQFEHVSSPQPLLPGHGMQYGQHQPYDMAAMSATLPQASHQTHQGHVMTIAGQYGSPNVPGMQPQQIPLPPNMQRQPGLGLHFDPATMNRFQQQQQQYMGQQFVPHSPVNQRSPINQQGHGQYGTMDPYGYGQYPMHPPPFNPRYAPQIPYGMNRPHPGDMSQFVRRPSEPAIIPSFPRGPPRKPKQSGHALWVGNLPTAATVTDLKDHFSRDATRDIESLFLISKSNCAFVNYRTEEACTAAMHRFHDSRFHGVRLVCRLRRGTNIGGGGESSTGASAAATASLDQPPSAPATPKLDVEEKSGPTIVGSSATTGIPGPSSDPATSKDEADKANDKYFIVKSLTVQDLEASVRNLVWATQSHNEAALSRAYEDADNVFLIFSANKSGEYFGYARMSSTISGEPVNLGSPPNTSVDEPLSPGAPQSIPTAATTTAPRGRIIDDSARGTIFWEADHSDAEEREESPDKESRAEAGEGGGQNWGRQFSVEWLSTARLPFYRTRGLRNPWNANREVKIARDGTELEPSIGRRLVQMFHRPPPSPSNLAHYGSLPVPQQPF